MLTRNSSDYRVNSNDEIGGGDAYKKIECI